MRVELLLPGTGSDLPVGAIIGIAIAVIIGGGIVLWLSLRKR